MSPHEWFLDHCGIKPHQNTEKFHQLFRKDREERDPQADITSERWEQIGELMQRIWSETFGNLRDEGPEVTLLLLSTS